MALDAGISTGGFTHCLLMNGVQRVYGVDVGYGQVTKFSFSLGVLGVQSRGFRGF